MILKEVKKIRIGVLTAPLLGAGITPLSNLLNILSVQSQSLCLITGNKGTNYFKNNAQIVSLGINHQSEKNTCLRILNFLYLQIRIAVAFIKIGKKCDIWIFFLGGEIMVLPLVMAKLFRKKVILLFSGSSVNIHNFDHSVKNWLQILTLINCTLCDKLILYSDNLVKEWNLEKWANKIEFAHEHVIDFQKFKIVRHQHERDNLIGFIGRLSEEKGIWNFIYAIEILINDRQDFKFLIIGDGSLRVQIEHYIDQKKLHNFVKIEGWVSHDVLPVYFNSLKLLVIPSYTEGLPNTMLESMACGTPVLATPVGVIPNMIRNGETGFIMENNSPQCIAENIIIALENSNLEKIAVQANKMIARDFTFEIVVQKWKRIVEKI